MHILVINGSPKGSYSITLQTINYLQKLHPEHTFEALHAGKQIKKLEKDFSPALEAIHRAELILFSYPVYTFIAPYQLHRFIELLKESGISMPMLNAMQYGEELVGSLIHKQYPGLFPLDIWLDDGNVPVRAEVLYDGSRILSMEITDFQIS